VTDKLGIEVGAVLKPYPLFMFSVVLNPKRAKIEVKYEINRKGQRPIQQRYM